MNIEETKKAIEVMQAYVDGAEVEKDPYHQGVWDASVPQWDWLDCRYRIKPKPPEIMVIGNGFPYSPQVSWNGLEQLEAGKCYTFVLKEDL